jgi:hypothetical protein
VVDLGEGRVKLWLGPEIQDWAGERRQMTILTARSIRLIRDG